MQYKPNANAPATCFTTTVVGDFGFSLGDPFLVKYPSTYFAQGIPALATPLPSTTLPTVCFYGTVPVRLFIILPLLSSIFKGWGMLFKLAHCPFKCKGVWAS